MFTFTEPACQSAPGKIGTLRMLKEASSLLDRRFSMRLWGMWHSSNNRDDTGWPRDLSLTPDGWWARREESKGAPFHVYFTSQPPCVTHSVVRGTHSTLSVVTAWHLTNKLKNPLPSSPVPACLSSSWLRAMQGPTWYSSLGFDPERLLHVHRVL